MTQSMTYRKNLEIFGSRFPEVASQLENVDTKDLQVVPARRRGLTLRTSDGITLHSSVDPVREAEELIQSRNISGGTRWLIFGFGLGYHLGAAVRAAKDGDEIVVVEFCPEILKSALENIDLTWLLRCPGLRICLPRDAAAFDRRIGAMGDDTKILIHPPSLALWRRRRLQAADMLNTLEIERTNWLYSGSAYEKAVKRNRAQLAVCENAETYFKNLKDEPLVVAGAGPSLNHAKPLIKRYRSSLFVLAANAAYFPLRNAGIQPDAVICVEPRSAARSSFDGRGEDGIPLLFAPGTNPDVIANWHGPKVVAIGKDDQSMPHTGTVVGAALDVAFRLGANPIILTGVDLALSDSWYAEGVKKSASEAAGKIISTHATLCQPVELMGVEGQMVPSTPAFRHFVNTLGNLIENARSQNPALKIYDLKAKGARIDGTIVILPTSKSFETVLGTKYRSKRPSTMIEEFLSAGVR
jgi:hypothetical protein